MCPRWLLRHQTHYWHGCSGVIKFPLPGLLTYVHSKFWTIHTYLCICMTHSYCGGGIHYGFGLHTYHFSLKFQFRPVYILHTLVLLYRYYIPAKSIQRGEETSQRDVPHGPSKVSLVHNVQNCCCGRLGVDNVPGTLLTVQGVVPMDLCAFRVLNWWPIPKKWPQKRKKHSTGSEINNSKSFWPYKKTGSKTYSVCI